MKQYGFRGARTIYSILVTVRKIIPWRPKGKSVGAAHRTASRCSGTIISEKETRFYSLNVPSSTARVRKLRVELLLVPCKDPYNASHEII